MALVLTIDAINRTAILIVDSLRVEQRAADFISIFTLTLLDDDGDVVIDHEDDISLVDGATTFFSGRVVDVDYMTFTTGSRKIRLQCQDLNWQLGETVIDGLEEFSAEADADVIDSLFDDYLPAVDSETFVDTIKDPLTISFEPMTLQSALSQIATQTGGYYYIDFDNKLHYFISEETDVGFGLSDEPGTAPADPNLCTNPSFEVDTSGWIRTNAPDTFERVVTEHFDGVASLHMAHDGGVQRGTQFGSIVVAASTTYTITLWVKGSGGDVVVWLNERNAADGNIGTTTEVVTLTTSWRRVTITRAFGVVGEKLRLYILTNTANATDWYTDLVRIGEPMPTYSYFDLPLKTVRASTRLDGVFVVGAGVEGWVGDHGAGDRTAIVVDNRITTGPGVTNRGNAILARKGDEQVTYMVETYQAGLVAGLDVRFICGLYDVDDTFTVRKQVIRWDVDKTAMYELELGDPINPSLVNQQIFVGGINDALGPIISPRLPTSAQGWGHDLVFSATDHDTVAWAGGDITLADGTVYNIDAGNTGNIAAKTYIFLDLDTSETVLQTTGAFGIAVGSGKIRVAWAQNQAAGIDATFFVFGGVGQGVLVDTDNIVDGAVDTLQIAALAVEAAKIGAQAVETGKLALLAVENAQLGNEAVSAGKILANTITAAQIDALTITAAEIKAGTITTAEIKAATIVTGNIAAGTITGGNIKADTIESVNIKANTIETGDIKANAITATEIAAGAITADKMAANSIAAGNIIAGAVETDKLDAGAVTAAKIEANTIVATTLDMGNFGDLVFTGDNGLLLLGPHNEISPTEWFTARRQLATLSGAFHQESGRWSGTRGLVIEEAGLNYELGPRLAEDGATGLAKSWGYFDNLGSGGNATLDVVVHPVEKRGWLQRITYTGAVGDVNDNIILFSYTATGSFAQGDDVTISLDIKGALSGCTCRLTGFEADAATVTGTAHDKAITLTSELERVELTFTTVDADCSKIGVWVQVRGVDNGDEADVHFGAVNIEKKPYATTLIHGALGVGYAWSGVADVSTSTRAATEVNLDDHVALVSQIAAISILIRVQVPYDADADWAQEVSLFSAMVKNDTAQRIMIIYNDAADTFQLSLDDGVDDVTLESAAQTFDAGEWFDLIGTATFNAAGAGDYKFYINGLLVDSATTANIAGPIIEQWNLGTWIDGSGHSNITVAEYAVWNTHLSADEVASIYALNRPIVDAGSIDTPGIYILDGKFKIASSVSGNRIEIISEEIAGYDAAGTKQFYLRSSDGKALAGAGAVILDEKGITMAAGDGETNTIKWKDGDGDELAAIFAYDNTPEVGDLIIRATNKDVGDRARVIVLAVHDSLDDASISILSEVGGTESMILMSAFSVRVGGGLYVGSTGTEPDDNDIWIVGELDTSGAGTNRWKFHSYVGGTVADTGYVTVTINGTNYQLLARA